MPNYDIPNYEMPNYDPPYVTKSEIRFRHIGGAGQLTYWNVALRLVVLVQPSSASAERVFTQLKLILETCGDSMLAQTLRVRLSHRCNGHDLRKIYVGVD